MNKRLLLALGWFTLIGFSLLGCLFIYLWVEKDVISHLNGKTGLWFQFLSGGSFGLGAGLFALFLVSRPFLQETNTFYASIIAPLRLRFHEIIFLSLCAGIGEEILFRAALQEIFGLWPVAIVFVAIHGYLNPFNLRLSVYGLFMVCISAGFGFLYAHLGIYAAATAHFIFDVLMLSHLSNITYSSNNYPEEE